MFVVLNSVLFAIKMAGGFDKLNPSLLETTVQLHHERVLSFQR